MAMGGLPAEFLKSETEYRRERLARQWRRPTPKHRPEVADRPFGVLLHRFGVRLGTVGAAGC